MTRQPFVDPSDDDYRTAVAQPVPGRLPDSAQQVVASYPTYRHAELAVDYLSDQGFPVERVAIVGRGLQSVEQVTGRLTIWGAAGRSALTGAVIGGLFGWLFGLFDLVNPLVAGLVLALYGIVFGAAVGAVLGLVGHALTGGRRDFRSRMAFVADSYDVVVASDLATQAINLLEGPRGPGRGTVDTHFG
jgi:hypothetical protein